METNILNVFHDRQRVKALRHFARQEWDQARPEERLKYIKELARLVEDEYGVRKHLPWRYVRTLQNHTVGMLVDNDKTRGYVLNEALVGFSISDNVNGIAMHKDPFANMFVLDCVFHEVYHEKQAEMYQAAIKGRLTLEEELIAKTEYWNIENNISLPNGKTGSAYIRGDMNDSLGIMFYYAQPIEQRAMKVTYEMMDTFASRLGEEDKSLADEIRDYAARSRDHLRAISDFEKMFGIENSYYEIGLCIQKYVGHMDTKPDPFVEKAFLMEAEKTYNRMMQLKATPELDQVAKDIEAELTKRKQEIKDAGQISH